MLWSSEGKKQKSKPHKNKKQKKLEKRLAKRHMSRIEGIIGSIHPVYKEIWFNNDKDKMIEYARWIIEQDEKMNDLALSEIDSDSDLQNELDKLKVKKCRNFDEVIEVIRKEKKIYKKKNARDTMRRIGCNKDLGIATLLNPNTYSKQYLSNSEYRKELKKLAKREEKEFEEMKRQGFVVDCTLKGYEEKLAKRGGVHELVKVVLSDEFATKHPL